MPKIIFTSRYLRDAPPAQLENYVRYVSTREGVEKVEGSRQNLPSTAQQKDLIRQIVRDFPSAKEMLEYADFLLHPTMGNASEFIFCAMEKNLDLTGSRFDPTSSPCGVRRPQGSAMTARSTESRWEFSM